MILSLESAGWFLIGMLVGLVLAIPVGPIAILCMRRTLERGPVFGFATGLGAALADGMYGAVAAFGIAAISDFVERHDIAVRLVGGIFMLVLAVRLMRSHGMPRRAMEASTTGPALGALLSGLFLTATNPMTMFGFAAVFTSFHLTRATDLASFMVIGIALGSALWWLILTLAVSRLRHHLSEKTLHIINLVAGGLLAAFGAFALVDVVIKILNR